MSQGGWTQFRAAPAHLVLLVDAGEGLLQGILGARVEHLGLDGRVVIRPRHENELVGGGTRLGVDLDVEDRVAAVAVGQLAAELSEIVTLLTLVFNHYALLVVRDFEDDERIRRANLHLLKLLDALLRAYDTR